jgi:hypothetical protein
MKTLVATIYVVLAAVTASAQSAQQQQQAQAHKARVELWTGIAFASAGAWIAPATAAGDSRNEGAVWGGVGLIGIGGTLIYKGIRDRSQALHPSTKIGVMIGPRVGVQVRRRW